MVDKIIIQKTTPARTAILNTFKKNPRPLNAEDVYSYLSGTGIDRVTIYRNLSSFERAGILRRLDLRMEAVFYELEEGHHHHLVCTTCGRVEDIDHLDTEDLSKIALKKSKNFASIKSHSLEFFGQCIKCTESSEGK